MVTNHEDQPFLIARGRPTRAASPIIGVLRAAFCMQFNGLVVTGITGTSDILAPFGFFSLIGHSARGGGLEIQLVWMGAGSVNHEGREQHEGDRRAGACDRGILAAGLLGLARIVLVGILDDGPRVPSDGPQLVSERRRVFASDGVHSGGIARSS